MYNEKIQLALQTAFDEISDDFPTSMPLLDRFRCAHRRPGHALADVDVLVIQHHLGPLLMRLQALFDEGLRPERTWLVDIPYSTNERVRDEIPRRFGIPRTQMSPPLRDPTAPYALLQLRRVEEVAYRPAHRGSPSRLLVIDDGAYFVRAIKHIEDLEPGFARAFAGNTAIVEQTTRGHRYLEEPAYRQMLEEVLEAPAVTIARCRAKTEVEAPFIRAAASRAVVAALRREGVDLDQLERMAIIGFGPIGQSVFHALHQGRHGRPIAVVEKDRAKHAAIAAAGGEPCGVLPPDGRFDLVGGCTGYASFDLQDWDSLSDDAYLVSTSSAAVTVNVSWTWPSSILTTSYESSIRRKRRKRGSGRWSGFTTAAGAVG